MMRLVILTGASGAGKTTIARGLDARYEQVHCFFFDSIGVPPLEEMIAEYGSGEDWQHGKTMEWLRDIKAKI